MVKIIDVSVFGATGDQKSDVENPQKNLAETSNHERYSVFNRFKNGLRSSENQLNKHQCFRMQISLSRWFIEIAYVDFDEKNKILNFELFTTQKILER